MPQDSLVETTIPIAATLLSVDELGNIYAVKNGNTLIRYSAQGDSNAVFNSASYGQIDAIDATNPLRVIVYFQKFFRVLVLDRLLTVQQEIDLRRLRLLQAPTVASSADGQVWVYDQFNARLLKVNDQGLITIQSNDLRVEAGVVPKPTFMVERDWRVFVCDPKEGVLVFDRYANLLSTIPQSGAARIQVTGDVFIYRLADTLHLLNLKTSIEAAMPLPLTPEPIIDAWLHRGKLYLQFPKQIVIRTAPALTH